MLKRCFSIVFVILAWCAAPGLVTAAEQPSGEAQVTMLEGSAQALGAGATKGRSIRKGDRLAKDQEVRVGERSRIELRFPDGTVMRFSEKSSVKLNDVYYNKASGDKSVKVDLSLVKLWAKVKKLTTTDSRVEVKTTNAVAGVRGTVYRVNVEEDKSALVKVYDGAVYVANPPRDATGKPPTQVSKPTEVPGPHEVPPPYHEVSMEEWTVIVQAMQQITISPQGVASKPQDFDPKADADDWVKWNQERD